MSAAQPFVWRDVHWSRPFETNRAALLLRRLASDAHRDLLAFELVVSAGEVRYLLGTPGHQVRAVSSVIEALAPGTSLVKPESARPTFPSAARLVLRNASVGLYVDRVEQATATVLAAMTEARFKQEEIVLHVVLGPGRPPRFNAHSIDPTQGMVDALVHGTRRPSSEVTARLRAKASENGFRAWIAVAARANSEGRRQTLMSGVLAALRTLQAPGTKVDFTHVSGAALDKANPLGWVHLSALEALSVLAWPIGDKQLPGLPSAHPKLLPWASKDTETVRTFGVTNAPGTAKPIGISIDDSMFHLAVTGSTGSGKSTVLQSLIVTDMQAGRSVVVLDQKRDLIMDLLDRVPPHRIDDVVVLDPSQDRPVGFNPLHVPGMEPHLVADGALNLFRSLFPSAFGPRTAEVTHAALLSLAYTERSVLPDLLRLFSDRAYRRTVVAGLPKDSGLDEYWASFETLSDAQQAQHIAPLASRLRQYLLRPGLRKVLSQREPRFDLQSIFRRPTILFVPANAGLLGTEATRLLGSALVATLWQLTLARAAVPERDRTPVSIVVDEAQEFVHSMGGDLADALARSRSLRVGWSLAHQFRDQMPRDVLAAIDANARNRIIFAGSPHDAKAMASMTNELSNEDFGSLPPYVAYARLMRGGVTMPWVSVATAAAPKVTSNAVKLLARSQELWGAQEEIIRDEPRGAGTLDQSSDEQPIGRRRRS